ncbi:LEA type 2 family protein [Candidatus Bathyarchaeota archaeon]|nr:LEA type 2 family protein [Candidatus Bathyarchaeota archaeon]
MGRKAAFILVILGLIAAFEVAYYIRYGVEPITEAVKPKIREVFLSWGNVTYDSTEIIADVSVYNPSPIPITLKKVTFTLYMNNIKMVTGSSEGTVNLASFQETVIRLVGTLNNSGIPDWFISHLKNGERTDVRLSGEVTFDLKLIELTRPFEQTLNITTSLLAGMNTNQAETLRIGPVELTLKSLTSSWGKITPEEIEINHKAVIYNPNPYPIPITKLEYEIYMNNIRMGGGTTYNPVILGAEKDTVILFTTVLDDSLLDEWWISHIKNGEKTRITIEIYSVIEIHNVTYKIKIYEIEQNITTNILAF